MSNRAEITQQLSLAFIRHLGLEDKRKYWAREVTSLHWKCCFACIGHLHEIV